MAIKTIREGTPATIEQVCDVCKESKVIAPEIDAGAFDGWANVTFTCKGGPGAIAWRRQVCPKCVPNLQAAIGDKGPFG